MDPNHVCSEDQSNPAVCYCICRYPLPSLCSEHLEKHPMDTDSFIHFHLPLCAPQRISTEEIKVQYEPWLFNMHRAGKFLKENDRHLKEFEEHLEAEMQAVMNEFANAKQKVADLREAFNAEVQTAIKETREHVLEQWTPDSQSLSAYVWNFGSSYQWSLKLFDFSVEKQSISAALQVNIQTCIPSLSHFNKCAQQSKEQIEIGKLTLQAEELTTENAKMRQEIQELKETCASLSDVLKETTDVTLTRLKKEKEKLEFENHAQVNRLKLKLARLKKSSTEETKRLRDEIKIWKSVHNEVDALKEQGVNEKAAGRYKESFTLLNNAWDLIKNKTVAFKQTTAVGLVLGELLGIHLCRIIESESVINKTLEVVQARTPNSEEEIIILNFQAALYFHTNRNFRCEAVCKEILPKYHLIIRNPCQYWTTAYYFAFALCAQEKTVEAETLYKQWCEKQPYSKESFASMLKLGIKGEITCQQQNYLEAESAFKEALVEGNHYSNSIFTATNLYYLGKLYHKQGYLEESRAKFCDAHALFSVHFPGSIYFAHTLTSLAVISNDQGQLADAISKRVEAQRVFNMLYPPSIHAAVNLTNLAALFEKNGQVEDAARTYVEARKYYAKYFTTSNEAALNLYTLACIHAEAGRNSEAKECASSSLAIAKRGNCADRIQPAEELIEKLSRVEK